MATMRLWWCVGALGLLLAGGFGCKSVPQAELDDAESALLAAADKRECAEEQYRAAERLLAEAQAHVEEGDYAAAERKAIAARRLAEEAREYAELNWEDCQRRIAEAARAAEAAQAVQQESSRATTEREQPREAAATRNLEVVYFPYNSSEMSRASLDALESNLAWLRENPSARIRLEGHTDERGTPEYNLALGQRRANYVRNYLVQRGVDRDRLEILSYGQEILVSRGQSEADHARNRRVEFVPLGAR